MAYQATFRRYEIKYLLTQGQKDALLQAMEPYMELEKFPFHKKSLYKNLVRD